MIVTTLHNVHRFGKPYLTKAGDLNVAADIVNALGTDAIYYSAIDDDDVESLKRLYSIEYIKSSEDLFNSLNEDDVILIPMISLSRLDDESVVKDLTKFYKMIANSKAKVAILNVCRQKIDYSSMFDESLSSLKKAFESMMSKAFYIVHDETMLDDRYNSIKSPTQLLWYDASKLKHREFTNDLHRYLSFYRPSRFKGINNWIEEVRSNKNNSYCLVCNTKINSEIDNFVNDAQDDLFEIVDDIVSASSAIQDNHSVLARTSFNLDEMSCIASNFDYYLNTTDYNALASEGVIPDYLIIEYVMFEALYLGLPNRWSEFSIASMPPKAAEEARLLNQMTLEEQSSYFDRKFNVTDFIAFLNSLECRKRALIIGAGIYGRYSADLLHNYGFDTTIIASDDSLSVNNSKYNTASLINQARVHNGYHYPRSVSTAKESSKNYAKFKEFMSDEIIPFRQIYAIPKIGTFTNALQFTKFCDRIGVKCDNTILDIVNYDKVEATFDTDEVAIDTTKMMSKIANKFTYDNYVEGIVIDLDYDSMHKKWSVTFRDKTDKINYLHDYDLVINCSYSGIKTIEQMVDELSFTTNVKFELCEVAIFKDVNNVLSNTGITFMDGPFISFMPWSQDGKWSLTSVCHTPHLEMSDLSTRLDVRNTTSNKDVMIRQLKKFIKSDVVEELEFEESYYVIKTINVNAENDDNRNVVVNFDDKLNFASVLSGKLDAIFELDNMFSEKGIIRRNVKN